MKDSPPIDDPAAMDDLMRDILRYERTIGDLIQRNEELSSQNAVFREERDSWFDNKLTAMGSDISALATVVLRLAEQQGRETAGILGMLADLRLAQAGVAEPPRALTESHARLSAYNDAVARVLSGRSREKLVEHKIEIDPGMDIKAVRGSLRFTDELDPRNRMAVSLEETGAHGVHAIVFPLPEVTASGLRGASIEVLPQALSSLRLRFRAADDKANSSEVTVDLKAGRYGQMRSSFPEGRHDVTIKPLQGGWTQVVFESALGLGECPAELEVIGLNHPRDVSSQRPGSRKPAFAVRALRAIASDGLEPVPEHDTDRGEMRRGTPTVIQHNLRSSADERRRAEKRAAYLASGAYSDLTKFRNIHAGKRAFVIGNGPSINGQDLTLLKDEVTFVTNWFVNHPDYEKIDPTYYCVSSHEMFGGWGVEQPRANPDWLAAMLARAGRSHKFFSSPFRDYLLNEGIFSARECDFLLFDRPKYQVDHRRDINLDLTQPMDDGYTGIITFCLPLAHYMGITEIYLVGCDCDYKLTTPDAPKAYFYDFSKHTSRTTSHEGLMRAWAEDGPIFQSYEIVRDRFALDGIRIVNCTAGGRLEVFPRADYETVVRGRSADAAG